ncbi:MAG: DUF4157 domain-containing protein [Candidatus Nitrosopolaris sp.]
MIQVVTSIIYSYDRGLVMILVMHADDKAAKSARSINALAYTLGNDIVVDETMYKSHTEEGEKLLAHELTHIVQQSQPFDKHM